MEMYRTQVVTIVGRIDSWKLWWKLGGNWRQSCCENWFNSPLQWHSGGPRCTILSTTTILFTMVSSSPITTVLYLYSMHRSGLCNQTMASYISIIAYGAVQLYTTLGGEEKKNVETRGIEPRTTSMLKRYHTTRPRPLRQMSQSPLKTDKISYCFFF